MKKSFKYCIAEFILFAMLFMIVACADVSDTKSDSITSSPTDQNSYSEEIKDTEATEEIAPDTTQNDTSAEETEPEKANNDVFPYPSDMDITQIFEDVQNNAWVVYQDSDIVSGIELWNEFCDKTSRGESAYVLQAQYYVNLLDRGSPIIYLSKLSYDGNTFKYVIQSHGEEKDVYREYEYKYLIKYDKNNKYIYILVDDNTYTYDQLMNSLFYSDSSKNIDFKIFTTIPY